MVKQYYNGPPKKQFTEEEKQRIYKKWLDNLQEVPATHEQSEAILEIQRRQSSKLQQNKKEWDRYFEENRGKIPNIMPRTIFDPDKDETS